MKTLAIALFATTSTCVSLGLYLPASAQTSAGPPNSGVPPSAVRQDSPLSVGEVVVTAQRRSENLQNVPIAVSTVSAVTLASAGVFTTQTLSDVVPGLSIETNTGNTQVFLRGVGTTQLQGDSSVATYVDGVYITTQNSALFSLNNIQDIEVLKGPQGTLFGRNALGGVIQVTTKDPTPIPRAQVDLGYSDFATSMANAYATTGITNNLAGNIALYIDNQDDGWGQNITTGKPTFTSQSASLRGKLLFTPDNATRILLAVDYDRERGSVGMDQHLLPGAIGADGKTTDVGFYNTAGTVNDVYIVNQGGVTLRAERDLGFARIVNIAAERLSHGYEGFDQDATPAVLVSGSPLDAPDNSYTDEFQILSSKQSRIKWIGGFFFLNDTYKFNATERGIIVPKPFSVLDIQSKRKTTSYAGYGQATIDLPYSSDLTIGVRYTDDERTIAGVTILGNAVAVNRAAQAASFSKVTYRAALDHRFTKDLLAYVSYNTGFKSGDFNLTSYAGPPVRPANLTAVEAGIKSELFERRLRLNIAGFHYDYKNIQITQTVAGSTQLLNAAAAESYGIDVDATTVISRELDLQGGFEYLHAKYTSFPDDPSYVPTGVGGNRLITINGAGKDMVHSPPETGYVTLNYHRELFSHYNGALAATYSYSNSYFWDPDNRLKQPIYSLLGATGTLSPSSKNWSLRLYGKNLFGEKYYSFETAGALGDLASPAAPRTFGFVVGFNF